MIDESQSSSQLLGGRRLIDLFAERGTLALDLVTSTDRVALFSAVRPSEQAITQEPASARDYLQALEPAAAQADLGRAIRLAAAWLESFDDRAREIHVLTDMQRISFPPASEARALSDAGRGVSVVVHAPATPARPNGAVAEPIPEVVPLSAGRHTTIAVPLAWYGDSLPGEPTVVRLVQGDNLLSIVEGRFGQLALIRLPPQDSGWIQGYVEIERHGLAADDRRYFTWFARPRVRVALLGDAGMFVHHALDALERGGRLVRAPPSEAEVWISLGGTAIAAAAGRSLVVIPPASALDLPRLNLQLARTRIPWRYEARPGALGATRIAEGAPLEGLAGLEVRESYTLRRTGLTAGDTVLIATSDGAPWLLRGSAAGEAAYLLLASPLTPASSDLPVSAAMVPFLDALLAEWARVGSFGHAAIDGAAAVRVPPRAREVRRPDGSAAAVEGGAWYQASQAGNYAVLADGSVVSAFSVNAPLPEADLARGGTDELEAVLPAASWTWIDAAGLEDWSDAIFRARRGRHAWRPLVVMLVLVSIVEVSLASAGRRRAGSTGGGGVGH